MTPTGGILDAYVDREGCVSFFDTAYEGSPPWDIGRPQGAVVRLEREGRIVGDVLDLGCGTGENALYLGERGHEVFGIDLAGTAVERAVAKARERRLDVRFGVWDALRVDALGRRFDTAIDVGMFHTLGDEERAPYARALHAALRPGGRLFLLCWSERNAWGFGPRRVTQMEIRGSFDDGWIVERIDDERFESTLDVEIHAWLAMIVRADSPP